MVGTDDKLRTPKIMIELSTCKNYRQSFSICGGVVRLYRSQLFGKICYDMRHVSLIVLQENCCYMILAGVRLQKNRWVKSALVNMGELVNLSFNFPNALLHSSVHSKGWFLRVRSVRGEAKLENFSICFL